MAALTLGLLIALLLVIATWLVLIRTGTQLKQARDRLAHAAARLRGAAPPIIVPIEERKPTERVMSQRRRRSRGTPGIVAKPTLLYVCPVVPGNTGSGLVMRAGMVLKLLAQRYRIWLLAMPVYMNGFPLPVELADLCENWAILTLDHGRDVLFKPWEELPEPPGGDTPVFGDIQFDVVHVFRLYSLPPARFYLRSCVASQLDLDDVESKTHARHAAYHHASGDDDAAERSEEKSTLYSRLEDQILDDFDRIFVCSEEDRLELQERTASPVCILPNGVPIPPLQPEKQRGDPFRFFFIGSIAYLPNHRGAIFFAREVMPLIRARSPRPIVFTIAGGTPSWFIEEMADVADLELVGKVPSVAPYYHATDVVIAPIASGGGTRVKVLEAFSYRRPVVSTSLGVEGIHARPEQELLVADTAEAFAEQCLRLMDDRQLAARLVDNAYRLVQREYSVEAVGRSIDTCVAVPAG